MTPSSSKGGDVASGITDEDMARILRYLQRKPHERTVDDLCPTDDE